MLHAKVLPDTVKSVKQKLHDSRSLNKLRSSIAADIDSICRHFCTPGRDCMHDKNV